MHGQMFTEGLAQAEELIQRVAALMHSRCAGQLRDLCITIREDGLILQGRVNTYYGKQMAQELAKQVSGLVIAANEIEVTQLGPAVVVGGDSHE